MFLAARLPEEFGRKKVFDHTGLDQRRPYTRKIREDEFFDHAASTLCHLDPCCQAADCCQYPAGQLSAARPQSIRLFERFVHALAVGEDHGDQAVHTSGVGQSQGEGGIDRSDCVTLVRQKPPSGQLKIPQAGGFVASFEPVLTVL
jgi:hypothetical protein